MNDNQFVEAMVDTLFYDNEKFQEFWETLSVKQQEEIERMLRDIVSRFIESYYM